ncbi:MAG: UPF0175 family protein, partial [Thiothrix litoralis]
MEVLEQTLRAGLQSGDSKPVSIFLEQYLDGKISLGKLAEKLQMEKTSLRKLLSRNGFAIIDYPATEVQAEVDFLLSNFPNLDGEH